MWDRPRCWHSPTARNGVLCFIEDPPVASDGFKPEYFAKLAAFEEGNFWFRARNQLIQLGASQLFSERQKFLRGWLRDRICASRIS